MSTKSYTSLRRLFAFVLTLLLICVTFSKGAEAQATTPIVTGSFATSLTAPSGLGTVEQTVLDSNGDWLVLDYPNGALYEYPVNGGAMITLAPPGTLGGVGGYQADGIVLDSFNNLYVAGNFNNCLLMFPYSATTNNWPGLATLDTTDNTGPDQCGIAPFSFARYGLITPVAPQTNNYFQPWGMALLPNNVLVIADQSGRFIMTLPIVYAPTPASSCSGSGECSPYVTPGTDNSSATTQVLLTMTKRATSVAADKFGNIYFVEDSGGLSGAYMIPAGDIAIPSDTDSRIVRVDPNLANVTGVATDVNGNLYIGDSSVGVMMVPNPAGTPNTSGAVLLTTVPATGQVSVDSMRDILYVPTSNGGLSKVRFAADLGSTPTGTPAASQSVLFGFNGSATPASFVIQEDGTPNFAIASGGTCAVGTAYAAKTGCSENVALSPHSAGSVSGKLLVLDAKNNIIGAITLRGSGTGSAIQVLPGGESTIGAGLKTPSQVAVDGAGNTYVADSGLGAVELYPKGYGSVAATATVGTGLTAPTGVAVDGAGDVFIADSGNVIEVPNGVSGLNAAGQVTLKSGLGTNLNLAADGVGHLYIADPTNQRVVKLGNLNGSFGLLGQTEVDLTGFNAPSAVAVDSTGDLFVADGPNLIEVTPTGTQTTVLTSLAGETGLAVDPSGALYVSEPGGTIRIPNQGGTLNASAATTVASNVAGPTSVAIDSAENLYITDGTAKDVAFVSSSASTNFGTLTSTSGTQSNQYTILDAGNSPLTVTGFANTPDYSETATTCTGTAVAVGATCTATITFNPGPGDQGSLSGEVLVQSNAANSPVGVNVIGVGAPLAASTTTVTVTKPTVDGAPAVITVAPASGKGAAPTGQVTLTITGTNLTTPIVVTGTLVNGTVTITPPQLAAGTYTFSVAYQGDRTYGTSTGSTSVTVAVGAVTLMQAALVPALNLVELGGKFYVLAGGNGAAEPYDGSTTQYTYTYPVTVVATDGIALIGQPIYDSKGKLISENYGTVTYQGAPFTATGLGCPPVSVSSNGTAPLDMTCLTIDTSNTSIPNIEDTYTITPMYSPVGTGSNAGYTNPNYSSVTGTPITVTALRSPMVQITSNPSSLSITPGSTATATLTLTSILGYGIGGAGGLLNNYSLPVQLACDGLPAYATCTFSYPKPDPTDPQSVDVGPPAGTVLSYMNGTAAACAAAAPGAVGGCFGPGTVIMTINTNIPTGATAALQHNHDETALAAMFGLGLLSFVFGKRKSLRERVPTLLCLLLCGGVVAGISGCSTKQLGTTSQTVATPAGTYMVLVTAKEVGSQAIAAPPGITYGSSTQVSLPFTISVTIQ
jgi:Bacterial Ig-like domain (group 3)